MPDIRRIAVVAGALALVLPAGAGAATRTYASFYSPSRNLSCEMNDRTYVYCQSRDKPHSVKLSLDGHLKLCRDTSTTMPHCLGDPGEHTPVLAYGKAISLKRFRCRSAQNGVTCTVIRTGKGFRIDGAGITRVGG